jgi:hypothetical protein
LCPSRRFTYGLGILWLQVDERSIIVARSRRTGAVHDRVDGSADAGKRCVQRPIPIGTLGQDGSRSEEKNGAGQR